MNNISSNSERLSLRVREYHSDIKKTLNNEYNRTVYAANTALKMLLEDIQCGLLIKKDGMFPFYTKSTHGIELGIQDYKSQAKIVPVANGLKLRKKMLLEFIQFLNSMGMSTPTALDPSRLFHYYIIKKSGSETSQDFWNKHHKHYFHTFLDTYLKLEFSLIQYALTPSNDVKSLSLFNIKHLNISTRNLSKKTTSSSQQNICESNQFENQQKKDINIKISSENILKSANTHSKHTNKGYVYILVNRSIPEFIKIGRTTRLPELRASELSTSTGVPIPYQVYHAVLVNDCSKLEKEIHEKLHHLRENVGREFFRLRPEEAKVILDEFSVKFKL